jgi:hypothetical protein
MLASLYLLVAIVGFTRNYLRSFAGTFEIHPIAHAHGALMAAWLSLFLTQTILAASGRLGRHRALGRFGIWLAAAIWISMAVATMRALIAHKPPVGHFLYNVLLVQLYAMAVFALFFVWGIRARRRAESHKRLLALSTLVLLQAAIDRMRWLPRPLPNFWSNALWLDALLLPLIVYDLVSIRRVHPITLIGAGVLVAAQTTVSLLWGTSAWHNFAHAIISATQ